MLVAALDAGPGVTGGGRTNSCLGAAHERHRSRDEYRRRRRGDWAGGARGRAGGGGPNLGPQPDHGQPRWTAHRIVGVVAMNPRNPWFAAGFLAGGAVGAAGALLAAPSRGDELLAALKAHWREAQREAREAGQRAEADVLTRYKAIRDASGVAQVGAASGVFVSPRETGAAGAPGSA